MTAPLLARRDAAQAAVDAFLGQAFAWGQADCVRLAASVLSHHGLPCDLNRAGTWDSPLKARRALKRLGYSGLGEAVDGRLLGGRVPRSARVDAAGVADDDDHDDDHRYDHLHYQ